MCMFFSALSDGKGKVIHFTPAKIAKLLAEGNPKNYNPNSHTSIADFHGIKGADEDKYNKWEYNPETKELKRDTINTTDDSVIVKKKIEKFLKENSNLDLRNIYGLNNGHYNNGHNNNGHNNNGHYNNGDNNNGDNNNGHNNNGNRNNGHYNNGNRNNGDNNNGHNNNGDNNNGHYNNGNRNNGNRNNGEIRNSFCIGKQFILFNKPCTEEEYNQIYNLPYFNSNISEFIYSDNMTDEEKQHHPEHKTTGGYIKTLGYKEAMKYAPKKWIEAVKKLPNFNKEMFEEITGLKV